MTAARLDALASSERTWRSLRQQWRAALQASVLSDLEKIYAEVANELRHQYALYYSPRIESVTAPSDALKPRLAIRRFA